MRFCTSTPMYGDILKVTLSSTTDIVLLLQTTLACKSNTFWFFLDSQDEKLMDTISEIFKDREIHFFIPYNGINTITRENLSYSAIVSTFYDLHHIMNAHPEYIYISGELLFNVNRIKKFNQKFIGTPYYCKENNLYQNDDLLKAFIPPRAIQFYEDIFYAIDVTLSKDEKTLYNYYSKQKQVYGDLSLLIPGISLNDKFIPIEFYIHRLNCDRICIKTNKCKKCFRDKEVSKFLEDYHRQESLNNNLEMSRLSQSHVMEEPNDEKR